MNVVKFIKWLIVVALLVLVIKYLGELLIMLIGSFILFSMLLPLKKNIQTILSKWIHKKWNFNTLSSILSIIFPFIVVLFVLMYVFPVIIHQLNSLTHLSYERVFDNIITQFPFFDNIVTYLGGKKYVLQSIQDAMHQIINISIIAQWSTILLDNLSKVLMNLLIIFFITFHLLKDDAFINKALAVFTHPNYFSGMEEIIAHVKDILGRYFRGLLIDIVIISVVNTLLMTLLGIKNAFLIGVLSGVLNIIPYIGPLVTLLVGLFLGVSGDIIEMHYNLIPYTVTKIIIVLVVVNIIDGTIIQPYIFSNVLRAHPLEIFIVIIAAGMLGGIIGMMLAIPVYVIFKVVLKETLDHWKNWT